jgi:hypothetical protein
MNKFAASLGILALGTTALHAVEATALNSMQRTKPWSVAASLRGFYDDNVSTTPDKQASSGFEITPSVDYGLIGDQTSFNLGYQFSGRYYETPIAGQNDHWDYTHTFDGVLSHTFNPRVNMLVRDSFVIGQEPDMLRAGDLPFSTVQRVSGDNIVNYGSIGVNTEVTELLGFALTYNNAYYNYADDGGTIFSPSTAGLLNRIENRFSIDSQWKLRPETIGIIGYMYGQYLYTGDEPILILSNGQIVNSDFKDSRSHTMYVGVQQAFTPTLSGTVKAGAQYFDYYGDPAGDTQWSPYVMANLRYLYQTMTTMNFGFSYSRSAADQAGQVGGTDYIKDTEVALLYGEVSHEIVPHLVGTIKATLQYATYNGGGAGFNDQSYLYFEGGFDVAYQFSPYVSAHAGYNYDNNNSDIAGQSYNRNRVYIGLTAGY